MALTGLRRGLAYLRDPFHKNSLFLIASIVVGNLLGFFFWVVAARLFPAEDVGLAAALQAAGSLLATLSLLGFNIGLIRFLPQEGEKDQMINTALTLVALVSVALVVTFIAGIRVWSPALSFLQRDWPFASTFAFFTVTMGLTILLGSIFIAFESSQYRFWLEFLGDLRFLFLPLVRALGAFGIFALSAAMLGVQFILGSWFVRRLRPAYRPLPTLQRRSAQVLFRYSFLNYLAENMTVLPGLLLPLLVLNLRSPEDNAYFYAAWSIGSVLFGVAQFTSLSLLARVSSEPGILGKEVMKAARFIFPIVSSGIVLTFLLGGLVLSLFGPEYAARGRLLLWVLALSSLPVTLNTLYVTVQRYRHNMRPVILLYTFVAAATLLGSYGLLGRMGLLGIGVAWLGAHLAANVAVGLAERSSIAFVARGLLPSRSHG